MSRRHKHRGVGSRREEGAFLAIPMAFLTSEVYRNLSRPAKVLLLDMGAQYSLSEPNNGRLIATMNKLRSRGWKSEVTLLKARKELEDAKVIVETRKGGFPNRATWYALTFFSLDHHKDHDITLGSYVRGDWRLANGIKLGKTGRLLQQLAPALPDSTISCSPPTPEATNVIAIRPTSPTPLAPPAVVVSRSSHLLRPAMAESC